MTRTVNRRNVAVVLAGGTGTRVGLTLPKQLIKIAGKSIIEHTIASADTVISVADDRAEISDVLPRHRLRRGQTAAVVPALGAPRGLCARC